MTERDLLRLPPVSGDVLFSVVAAEYLTYCTAKGLRADTVTRYEGIIRGDLLPTLGSLRLSEIGREQIVPLRDSLSVRLSPARRSPCADATQTSTASTGPSRGRFVRCRW